jgi:hypothetical protein
MDESILNLDRACNKMKQDKISGVFWTDLY